MTVDLILLGVIVVILTMAVTRGFLKIKDELDG